MWLTEEGENKCLFELLFDQVCQWISIISDTQ